MADKKKSLWGMLTDPEPHRKSPPAKDKPKPKQKPNTASGKGGSTYDMSSGKAKKMTAAQKRVKVGDKKKSPPLSGWGT